MVDWDFFKGLTEAELLAINKGALDKFKENPGQVLTSVSTRDLTLNFSEGRSMTPAEVAKGSRWGLQRINPSKWGTDLIQRTKVFGL